jgi:hypothetical protein
MWDAADILEISSADALNSIATTASAIKSAVLAPIMCTPKTSSVLHQQGFSNPSKSALARAT